jgi:hypothetical protein
LIEGIHLSSGYSFGPRHQPSAILGHNLPRINLNHRRENEEGRLTKDAMRFWDTQRVYEIHANGQTVSWKVVKLCLSIRQISQGH